MGGLFAPKTSQVTTPAPAPKPVATMPDTESAGAIEARQRKQAELLRRGGRSSTILTAPDKRGGDNYSAAKLG